MPVARKRKTQSLTAKAAELAVAAPQVVAHRVARMAMAGLSPSPRDRKEFKLMSDEKTAAFHESWNAMAAQAVLANQALAASVARTLWSPSVKGKNSASALAGEMRNAALGVLGKGMAPVHRRAVANAKRLARLKVR